jgi:formylglycine-generating enzyme required for sulfatase activity
VDWKDITEEQRKTFSAYCNGGKADHGPHPVNCVDWTSAKAYCESRGARLPTEAEWEFAARGSIGRRYAWGDAAPSERRTNACGAECKRTFPNVKTAYEGDDGWVGTAPVGTYPLGATPEGLQDMTGNVWEWTSDCYGPYASGAQKNPSIEQDSCRARVNRGGGWSSSAAGLRASFRIGFEPAVRYNFVGFRCARGVSF